MNIYKKVIIYLLFIYIIIVSIYLIYRVNQGPVYNQELFDEISNQYEELKNEDYTKNTNNITIKNDVKTNPTYLTVNAQGNEYKIIGTIIINKLDINYPIISKTTDEYLKIAPCKLCGPLINTTGNLCIIGHNYTNNKLFSNIYKLQKNDIVTLIDNNDNSVDYKIYDKYEVQSNDTTCLDQSTNGLTNLTLITCTNKNNKRLVIKCSKEEW